jgi:hypothetical protein
MATCNGWNMSQYSMDWSKVQVLCDHTVYCVCLYCFYSTVEMCPLRFLNNRFYRIPNYTVSHHRTTYYCDSLKPKHVTAHGSLPVYYSIKLIWNCCSAGIWGPGHQIPEDSGSRPWSVTWVQFYSANCLSSAMAAALNRPAIGTVTNHAPTIFLWHKQTL